jgi:ferric-dicitrate binding protein FerR (iron transport regulator)
MDYQVTLSDGTKIWMNSATRLHFPTNFHADAREISIDGEAYLEVAQDAKRPFTVRLPNSSVQVLGTALNVNTYHPDVTNVALVSGAIQFSGGQTRLMLKPGEQVVYSEEGGISKQTFDPKFVLSWKKGLYYFEAADLNDIAMVIQRWFGVNTMIDSKDLLNTKVAGVLDKHQPLENFLDDLKAIAHIQAYFDKAGVLHFK